MARCMYDYNIGDFVYEPYTPQKPAKIIANLGDSYNNGRWNSRGVTSTVTIKFLNGTTKNDDSIYLRSFDDLIADHRKKLQTHLDKLL